MSTLTQNPLTEAEYDRLEAFLANLPGEDAMNLEELDGFFTALICGPETLMPSKYLPLVMGADVEDEPAFATLEEARDILELMMRHWNHIAVTLGAGETYFPVLFEYDDGVICGNDWAVGFSRGIGLRPEGWEAVIENDEMSDYLAPVILLSQELDPESTEDPITPERRDELLALLVAGLPEIFAYFEPERRVGVEAAAGIQPYHRPYTKVGRNEPCPCGSGRKYKHCCAESESLH